MADSKIKVLLLAGRFEVRGSSAYTLLLAEHLPEAEVAVRTFCADARNVEPERRRALSIREYHNLQFPLWRRVMLDLMWRELKAKPPDLIHIQSRSVLREGVWLAERLDRPFVLTLHDYLGPGERLRFDRRHGRRIIAVSESVRSELQKQIDLPAELITVIYTGVEPPQTVATRPVLDPEHVPVIGTAGPLESIKGLPYFIGAAQRLLAEGWDAEFLVAGAGPEEANLRRLARELAIDKRVTFVSGMYDFTPSLAAMDVFCLTSLSQGLGTIMLQAMALGKPVIATRVGGVYAVVRDGETGLIVPPSDSARLAERIGELLGDPVRSRAIGEAGRQFVREEFGLKQMIEQTAEVYREAVAKPAAVKSQKEMGDAE